LGTCDSNTNGPAEITFSGLPAPTASNSRVAAATIPFCSCEVRSGKSWFGRVSNTLTVSSAISSARS